MNDGGNAKLIIGAIAILIYFMITGVNSTIDLFISSIIASMASAFFIYPVVKVIYGDDNIKLKSLPNYLLIGSVFLVIYIAYANMGTMDLIRLFLEKTIIITLVITLVNKTMEELK